MCLLLLFLTHDGFAALSKSIALELVRQTSLAHTDEHLVSARKCCRHTVEQPAVHTGKCISLFWCQITCAFAVIKRVTNGINFKEQNLCALRCITLL